MNTLIIGDIHGCHAELLALLDAAGLAAGDLVVSLGDVVDRGPDTPAVLAFFRQHPTARVVMGNHERKHVRGFDGEIELGLAQRIARRQIGAASYPAAVDWMRSLPYFIDLPDALLVHAMVEPGVPLDQQREHVLAGTMSGEAHVRARHARPWHELYDGAKPIIVGHASLGAGMQAYVRGDGMVIGLDTKCYAGGALTGIILPAFRLVSVPARANHWRTVKRTMAALEEETAQPLDGLEFAQLAALSAAHAAVASHARSAAARQLLEQAEAAVQDICDTLLAEHARIVSSLPADLTAGTEADARAFAKAYQQSIRAPSIAPLLHGLRTRGTLDVARLREQLTTPRAAFCLRRELSAARARAEANTTP